MNIKDILNSSLDVNLTIKVSDLKEFMREFVEEVHNKAVNEQARKENDELLTEKEVRKLLGVARSTLWKWAKIGYLPKVEVGGRRLWRLSDIQKILNRQ